MFRRGAVVFWLPGIDRLLQKMYSSMTVQGEKHEQLYLDSIKLETFVELVDSYEENTRPLLLFPASLNVAPNPTRV